MSQLGDDILCGEQILGLLRTARRKFFDRSANCGWIKRGHRLDCGGCEPVNCSAKTWSRRCRESAIPWPACFLGQCRFVAGLWLRKARGHSLPAEFQRLLSLPIHGQLTPRRCHGCGFIAAVPVGPDWTRMRTVRVQRVSATAACSLPIYARGPAAMLVVSDSYRADVLRIHRDCFADAETFGRKG